MASRLLPFPRSGLSRHRRDRSKRRRHHQTRPGVRCSGEPGRLESADLLTVHVFGGGCGGGVKLKLEPPVRAALPYLDSVEVIIMLGTELGVKGRGLAPQACDRLREARSLLREHAKRGVRLVADGGIRTHTVGELHAAGADAVVPGSLVFQSADLESTFRWLRSHSAPTVT